RCIGSRGSTRARWDSPVRTACTPPASIAARRTRSRDRDDLPATKAIGRQRHLRTVLGRSRAARRSCTNDLPPLRCPPPASEKELARRRLGRNVAEGPPRCLVLRGDRSRKGEEGVARSGGYAPERSPRQ